MDILVIVGPTAVGKTNYAIKKAIELDGEIVSADAMQVYKGLNIGSAKPDAFERSQAIHHLIDFVSPETDFSVAEYQKLALDTIKKIDKRGKTPIIAGGTGLYINSIIYDMDFSNLPKIEKYRAELYAQAEVYGATFLHEKLKLLDEEAAARIHPNNVKKVIRALEILENSKQAPAKSPAESSEDGLDSLELIGEKSSRRLRTFSESFKPRIGLNPTIIGLTRDRTELYARIDRRVDTLMEAGLVDEVEGLIKSGLSVGHIAMKGIGYKELYGYFQEEYDLNHAVYLIKRNSRRYAKRQLTWFKRYDNIIWLNLSEQSDIK